MKYVDVTGDKDFLYCCGAEMLVETARLWYDLGFFSDCQDGRFCIHLVTGPDKYTTVVNNGSIRINKEFSSGRVSSSDDAS
jgi:alpha,alpha-trehalose phosphorylase